MPSAPLGNSQATRRRAAGEQSRSEVASDVEVVTDPEEAATATELQADPDDAELAHLQQAIGGLRLGGQVQVWRMKPTWCAGYLTTIHLAQGEELDLAQLKQDWGGGELRLRPQHRTPHGIRYAPGGGTIRISGPPRDQGREITPDGYVSPRALPPPSSAAAPVRQAPAPAMDPSMQMLLALVQQMMGLMMQERRQSRAAVERNPFDDFRQFMKVQNEFKQMLGAEDEDEDEPPQSSTTIDALATLLLKKYEEKDNKKPAAGAKSQPQWRLIKAGANGTPGPSASATTKPGMEGLFQQFASLSDEDKMELLGTAAAQMDPGLIKQWMAANGMGKAVGS